MLSNANHPLVMALHTVDSAAGLGEDKLIDTVFANLALEAVGVIRVLACHDRLVENGLLADIARVGAIGADGGAV